uniref:DNA-dependent metalloprotease SPRTN n=1 Tax=Esox lucius TaxID=8010 RepID=A0A3P9AL09_ESOLU
MDEDFLLAIQLQEQFNSECATTYTPTDDSNSYGQTNKKRKVEYNSSVIAYSRPFMAPNIPTSIVDESWETLDPSPDVRAMFLEFNDTFFWGKLSGVEVKWSPRMTLCAGVCSYEGRGGLCSIRLSEPLLKLRPRRDLVQTLLHEMIHALLFVTQNNRDRDGHGPEFCKHMDRINQATGTKITVYHTFHDEVDLYRQHWWRCDGPCQTRRPYFGYVKRSMNRAPSSQDPWWGEHLRSCGGTYTKIKEPEGYGKKGKKTDNIQDKKPTDKPASKSKPASSGSQDIRNIIPFSGKGFLLGGSSQSPSLSQDPPVKRPLAPVSLQTKGSTASISGGPHGPVRAKKPPIKKSVSNTKAFVNINGSPVRIYKPTSLVNKTLNDTTDTSKMKQRSVQDLFNNSGWKSGSTVITNAFTVSKPPAESESATSSVVCLNFDPPAKAASSSNVKQLDSHPSALLVSSKPESTEPKQSKYFKGQEKHSGINTAVSKKRRWEDRTSSHIFDFFQKTMGESSPSTPRAANENPARASSQAAPSVVQDSAAIITVSCPVCQAKVQASKINAHLDTCLS